jgi:hypothetical protein
MPTIELAGFTGAAGTYTGLAPSIDAERAINIFSEQVPAGAHGKSAWVMLRTPGRKLFATLPTSPVRGIWHTGGWLYAVAGNKYYRLGQDGSVVATNNGDLGPFTSPVTFLPNGSQVLLVSGDQVWLDDGTAWSDQPNPSAGLIRVSFDGATQNDGPVGFTGSGPIINATQATYIKGFFVVQLENANQFNISSVAPNSNNIGGIQQMGGLSWNALDFASKDGAPDRLLRIIAVHDQLWLMGDSTTEVWYFSGAAGFPLQAIPGAFLETGIAAPYSAVIADNTLMWLGNDARGGMVVYRAQGYLPIRVSKHAIESIWNVYPLSKDAVAFAYQMGGHTFYQITFPSANATWVYDCATDQWHERLAWNSAAMRYDRDRAYYHAYNPVWQQHFEGDWNNGNIYTSSMQIYDDAGSTMRWRRTAPHVSDMNKRTFHSAFTLDLQMGAPATLNLLDGAGNPRPPQLMMRYSDNGGFTYRNERWVSAGQPGQFQGTERYRAQWRRCGYSRDRVYEVVGTDPVPVVLMGAFLKVDEGDAEPVVPRR